MSSPKRDHIGAIVRPCGHDGVFMADIRLVGKDSVMVVANPRAAEPEALFRKGEIGEPTHLMVDFPKTYYWNAKRGFFVVPKEQVQVVGKGAGDE